MLPEISEAKATLLCLRGKMDNMGSQSLCNARKPSALFRVFPQRQPLGHKSPTDLPECQGDMGRMKCGLHAPCRYLGCVREEISVWCLELHALFTKWSPGDWHHVRLRVPGA